MFRKALVVNDFGGYFRPLQHTNLIYTKDPNIVFQRPEEVAVVVFTGGEDVTPSVYGHKRHPTTGSSQERDDYEIEIAKRAISKGIPLFGICRGAQFLCAMAGGTLIQDLNNHAGVEHPLAYVDANGEERVSSEYVTSSHHQMQNPYSLPEDEYKVLAWTPKPLATRYAIEDKTYKADQVDPRIRNEPDCVLYPKIKALAIQYHPEWMDASTWGFQFATHLVDKHLMKWVTREMPAKAKPTWKYQVQREAGVDTDGWD